MKLSDNFWLYEFTRSQAATRLGIANTPGGPEIAELQALVTNVLQPLRDMVNRPINISSGYRCAALNNAIGAAANSQHVKGQAADIECFGLGNAALAKILFDYFRYDQLILEFHDPAAGPNSGWVHVSHRRDSQNRQETLRAVRDGAGQTVYARAAF